MHAEHWDLNASAGNLANWTCPTPPETSNGSCDPCGARQWWGNWAYGELTMRVNYLLQWSRPQRRSYVCCRYWRNAHFHIQKSCKKGSEYSNGFECLIPVSNAVQELQSIYTLRVIGLSNWRDGCLLSAIIASWSKLFLLLLNVKKSWYRLLRKWLCSRV